MKIRWWTILLFVLIMIDSIYTSHLHHKFGIGEANPLILWVMSTFNISLDAAMIVRIIWCIPFLYILNKYQWSKFTVFAYLGIYILLTGFAV